MLSFKTVTIVLALALLPAAARAQEPVENISANRHGNLAAAQDLVRQAFDKISTAQEANEFDLGGHAGKAKEYLRQANSELKQAAETINSRK